MNVEIVEEPIRFHLHGIGGVVENERYGEVAHWRSCLPTRRGQAGLCKRSKWGNAPQNHRMPTWQFAIDSLPPYESLLFELRIGGATTQRKKMVTAHRHLSNGAQTPCRLTFGKRGVPECRVRRKPDRVRRHMVSKDRHNSAAIAVFGRSPISHLRNLG
jgi:hypothetical protein